MEELISALKDDCSGKTQRKQIYFWLFIATFQKFTFNFFKDSFTTQLKFN